ncbi:hypothetical protein M413DRAFT_135615 [Hebeloma cylindrosporum]|uniref:Uncharacterized protein n=1 Tax=Hebeloma cylindrosporum TaxID=76867 RepID=A0A0C3CBQ2_HEBCY|nr:hypothetical protein M413DRAFT_135615 [Hebeloma cylindrosporum h7]
MVVGLLLYSLPFSSPLHFILKGPLEGHFSFFLYTMYSPLVLLAFLGVLASQVLAFNITLGDKTFAAAQLVDIPDSPVKAACSAICSSTTATLTACNDDATCLCQADTVASLLSCETCMFHNLIATNKPAPDVRAGSNVALGSYATACKTANQVLTPEQTLLQLPSNWDGPFVAVLPAGGAGVAVVVGGFLGISALMILSNLE